MQDQAPGTIILESVSSIPDACSWLLNSACKVQNVGSIMGTCSRHCSDNCSGHHSGHRHCEFCRPSNIGVRLLQHLTNVPNAKKNHVNTGMCAAFI